jgi:hypothetical protein
MLRITFALSLLAAMALLLPAAAGEFRKLYNGKDLTGWHVESGKLDSWNANGELISCVKPGGGYLATDQEYGDFELRLEYRIPPAGNTGVGIRFPRGGWPSTGGMEIQILDDDAPQHKSLKPSQYNGSIYSFVGPKSRPAKPAGQWNRMTVRCQGPHVSVSINGVEVVSANMDEHTEKGKGELPLSERPRKGLVGLQSHGDPVDFRNVEIREL